MHLVFLGPPGSGKGTLAKLISDKTNLRHISTGDLFRNAIKNETPLGLEIKRVVESGELVDDDLTINLVKEEFKLRNLDKGFILDGFPRNINQAIALSHLLNEIKVIYLEVSEDLVIKRLTGRKVCPSCNSIYNIYFKPPREDNICDICSSKLYQRRDDSLEAVKIRLEEYNRQTKPLVDFYRERDLLFVINASLKIEEVEREIIKILGEH